MDDVEYLLTEKFSQDPLEEYFSKQRGSGGSSDNPDSFQFGHTFNSLIVSASAAVRSTCGNCQNKRREEDSQPSALSDDALQKRKR